MNNLASTVAVKAGKIYEENSEMRLGQATWKALKEVCPGLARKVLNTKADPFRNDQNIDGFYFWLRRQVN